MSNALNQFQNQLRLVDQLISIHGRIQAGRGRRHQQDALHSAGVVMTVAAWQVYVERLVEEGLDLIAADLNAPGAPRWALHAFQLRRAEVLTQVRRFNTPNSTNVRDLFLNTFDFNTWDIWAWRQGPRQWTASDVRERTNAWVLVRHSVAHGFPLPANVPWLQGAGGQARLTLGLLEECRRHFVHLTQQTDRAFATHLAARHQLPQPW